MTKRKKALNDASPKGMSLDNIGGGYFGLALNGDALFTSPCSHHLRKVAQELDGVRAMPRREAMHYLTTDMGFCDNTAQCIFDGLHARTGTEALH